MAKTPATSPAGYCTGAEALDYCDYRNLRELLDDENAGAALGAAAVAAHPRWAALLLAASGELETACLVGGYYHAEDIQALVAAGGAGAALVRRTVAHLAQGEARRRRGLQEEDETGYLKAAHELLQALREGKRILPLVQTQQAGQASVTVLTAEDRRALNLPTSVYDRFFGRRLDGFRQE